MTQNYVIAVYMHYLPHSVASIGLLQYEVHDHYSAYDGIRIPYSDVDHSLRRLFLWGAGSTCTRTQVAFGLRIPLEPG